MPEIDADGCRLFFSVDGPAAAPVLLLSNALGTTAALWEQQRSAFANTFRVVRYDTRGHGHSSVPPGDYTLDRLGRDALRVLDAAGAERAHVCGISLGGLTAMWLGLHAPARVERLVLANTAARIGSRELWQQRIADVRASGLAAVAATVRGRWFTPAFCERHPAVVSSFTATLAGCSPNGYAGCAAALRDADLRADVGRITAPALVLVGRADPATPPADGDDLCARIPGARRADLDAAHLSNVEDAEAFTAAVLDFLSPGDDQRWTRSHAAAWAKPSGARSSATPTSTPPSRTRPD